MVTQSTAEFGEEAERYAADMDAAIAQQNWPRAYEISNRAISRGLRHPAFFLVRARRMEEGGHFQFALQDYERALELAPADVQTHDAIAVCAIKLEAFDRAVKAFDDAIAIEPDSAAFHYRRGLAFSLARDQDAAQRDFETALRLQPQFPEALASLASIMARKGNAAAARRLGTEALALEPRLAEATEALVRADMTERLYMDAEQKLQARLAERSLGGNDHANALNMLGDVLDAQKRYPEAYAAYSLANDQLRQLHAARFGGNQGTEAVRNLIGYFENESAARWRAPDDGGATEGEFAGHVFLLGFMRSGTTLLEQVLASNPNIVALEERGLLVGAGDQFLTSVRALNSLAKLEGADLARLRRQYWQRVREYLPNSAGKIFVDKQPLNTSKLPIIAKLFPRARILFALRDPRDVVFSCFRRNLRITATQFELLSLDSCARFYASVMRLGEVYREKLALNLLEHRYEAMVEDFEGRVRAVCEFIGAEWSDTMRRFDEHELVTDWRSPSAAQVRRPLYGDGIGQWKRYGEQLKPVLPILEPWVEKFGYPRD